VAAAAARLSAADLKEIEQAVPLEAVRGTRYDADGAALIEG
jgi:hypothetical protein